MAGLEVNLSRIIIKFYNPHTNYDCITSKNSHFWLPRNVNFARSPGYRAVSLGRVYEGGKERFCLCK